MPTCPYCMKEYSEDWMMHAQKCPNLPLAQKTCLGSQAAKEEITLCDYLKQRMEQLYDEAKEEYNSAKTQIERISKAEAPLNRPEIIKRKKFIVDMHLSNMRAIFGKMGELYDVAFTFNCLNRAAMDKVMNDTVFRYALF